MIWGGGGGNMCVCGRVKNKSPTPFRCGWNSCMQTIHSKFGCVIQQEWKWNRNECCERIHLFVSRKLFNHTKHMLCLNYWKPFISRGRVEQTPRMCMWMCYFLYVWLAMSNCIVHKQFFNSTSFSIWFVIRANRRQKQNSTIIHFIRRFLPLVFFFCNAPTKSDYLQRIGGTIMPLSLLYDLVYLYKVL